MPLHSQNKLPWMRLAEFDGFNNSIARLSHTDQLRRDFVNRLMVKAVHARFGLPNQLVKQRPGFDPDRVRSVVFHRRLLVLHGLLYLRLNILPECATQIDI